MPTPSTTMSSPPAISAGLFAATGSYVPIAIYIIGLSVVGLVCIILTGETFRASLVTVGTEAATETTPGPGTAPTQRAAL